MVFHAVSCCFMQFHEVPCSMKICVPFFSFVMYSWAKCSLDPVKMNAGAGPNAHLSVFEFEFDFHAVSICSMQHENLCSFSVSYHVFLFPFLNDTSWMDDRIGMMGSYQKMGTRASLPPFEL